MTCRQFIDYLETYLSGELSLPERLQMRLHLQVCPECVDYLESYRQTIRISKIACGHPDDPVPADVPEDLVKAVLAAMNARPAS